MCASVELLEAQGPAIICTAYAVGDPGCRAQGRLLLQSEHFSRRMIALKIFITAYGHALCCGLWMLVLSPSDVCLIDWFTCWFCI